MDLCDDFYNDEYLLEPNNNPALNMSNYCNVIN